jgi:hypothetical protein
MYAISDIRSIRRVQEDAHSCMRVLRVGAKKNSQQIFTHFTADAGGTCACLLLVTPRVRAQDGMANAGWAAGKKRSKSMGTG